MKYRIILWLSCLCVLGIVVSPSVVAQTPYTYTAESFEDSVWSSAPSSATPINAVTGTWTVATNNIRSTAIAAQDGAYSLLLANKTNALVSPMLENGAGVLTYHVIKTGSRTIWAQTSTDKVTWSSAIDSFVVQSTWTKRTVVINNRSVRYIRFTTNSNGSTYIDNVLITSMGAATVSVATSTPSEITQTSALVGGTVTSDDSSAVLSRGVCFNTGGFPDTSSSKVVANGKVGTFTATLTNLTAGVRYYLKAYAVTPIGVNYGSEMSFATLLPDAPIAYWMQPFNDDTQFPMADPASPLSITVPDQGTWIYFHAYKGSNPVYIKDGSATDLRMLKNGSYVITPVLTDGVSTLTYFEGRGDRVLTIYTSTDTGDVWTQWLVDTTTNAGVNIVPVNSSAVNRLKIANESGGDVDLDNVSVYVFPSGTPPTVTTVAVTAVGKNTALSGGEVASEGTNPVVERGVCWSTNSTPLIADHKTSDGKGSGTFISTLSGLPAGALVYARAYATSRSGTGYGNKYSFTTQTATIPVVTTAAVSTITGETAKSGGTITDGGGAPITQRGVCWNTSGTPTTANSKTMDSTGMGTFQSILINLTQTTKYYFRAYAVNSAGTGYGLVDSFTTGNVKLPAVTTTEVTTIYSYKATGGGNVIDDGNAPTVRGLCWNKTGSPTISDSKNVLGDGSGTFAGTISNIAASTQYFVRAYVTNSAGTTYGNVVTFTTLGSTTLYVSPTGDDVNGDGSQAKPFYSVQKAIDIVMPGDTIYMKGGTYNYARRINIGRSGTPDGGTIFLYAMNGGRALLNFSSMAVADSNQGIRLSGSYWHFYGLDVKGAGDNGMLIERNKPSGGTYADVVNRTDEAHDNIIENCTFFENRDSGLQMKNLAAYNRVINCDSYFNRDPAQGNADGFCPKLTVGTGNYFYGCRAWNNSDDGWDMLLSATDNGFPDDMTTVIENCWAFMNGYLKDFSRGTGNGNGFKMGGAGDRHNVILRRCLAFDNRQKGFDQNHNTGDMTLINCTGFARLGSGDYTYRVYEPLAEGKQLILTNCITVSDVGGTSLYAPYQLSFGIKTTCDFQTGAADYVTFDTAGVRGPRKPDGSLPDVNFMHLKPGNTKLIDQGTIVDGISYNGVKPDLGCFETIGSVGITEDERATPTTFALGQNYPNPFNPSTTIQYSVPKASRVTLEVYSLLGQRVTTLVNGTVAAGNHHVEWNADRVASGVYVYKVIANPIDGANAEVSVIVRKMMLVK